MWNWNARWRSEVVRWRGLMMSGIYSSQQQKEIGIYLSLAGMLEERRSGNKLSSSDHGVKEISYYIKHIKQSLRPKFKLKNLKTLYAKLLIIYIFENTFTKRNNTF